MSTKDARPDPDLLVASVGAVVFASDEPVQPKEIASAFGDIDVSEVEQAIDTLREAYERSGTGLHVERVAGGVRLATRPDVGEFTRQFFRQRNRARLSLAALETLAIVAYRQPITAPEIQAIRAKDPTAALKGLLDKKLLRCLGRKKVVGNPLLYGTTKHFLEHFGLNKLQDLPSIEEFDQFLEAFVGDVEETESAEGPEPAEGETVAGKEP